MRLVSALLASVFLLSSCTTSPTSGQSIFTGLVSTQQENELGASEHQKIIAQYNGVADNQALNDLVQKIGRKLAPYSERHDVNWTFTVLNDDIVNAFAVPGGYIYITRGLLNLAQDESQVAAVLAHEMGHINARHSAQQMSQSMVTNLGLSALSIATGSNLAGQAGSVGADLFIKSYSRAHELEADAQSVKYLAAAGYDPYANTKFLAMLEEYTELERRMAGSTEGKNLGSFFATHPPTPERVVRARALADQMPKVANAIVSRDTYLRAIDGTVYGDSAEQGFVRGQQFIHPGLGISFDVPEGFKLKNTPTKVIAENGKGAAVQFDMGQGGTTDPASYITTFWAAGSPLSEQQRITVNGMNAATAATQMSSSEDNVDAQLVAIDAGNGKYYRLIYAAPVGQMAKYSTEFRRSTYSFGRISKADAARISPNRVRLIKVKSGDTIQSLAAQMPVKDFAVERFCLLNGLTPNSKLEVGAVIKTVAAF